MEIRVEKGANVFRRKKIIKDNMKNIIKEPISINLSKREVTETNASSSLKEFYRILMSIN